VRVADVSLRPTAIAVNEFGWMYVVIDDPDASGPLLIPCSFAHRRIDVSREELAEKFALHAARPPEPKLVPDG
jgi:hypothetical protein